MNAPAKDADTTLDALAAALAPRVAKLLRERASNDGDAELADMLARAGYEIAADESGAA